MHIRGNIIINMKKLIALFLSSFTFAPILALAQGQINNINDVASKATLIGNTFVVLLISFAVIYIIYFTVRYFIAGGEEDRKKNGLNILWGIVGLFVILSVWGLVAILKNSFVTQNNVPTNQFPPVIIPPRN